MFFKKSRIRSKRASIFDVEDTYSVPTAKLQNIFFMATSCRIVVYASAGKKRGVIGSNVESKRESTFLCYTSN